MSGHALRQTYADEATEGKPSPPAWATPA